MIGGWAGGLGMRLLHVCTACYFSLLLFTLLTNCCFIMYGCFISACLHALATYFCLLPRQQTSSLLLDGWRLGWWFGHALTAYVRSSDVRAASTLHGILVAHGGFCTLLLLHYVWTLAWSALHTCSVHREKLSVPVQ